MAEEKRAMFNKVSEEEIEKGICLLKQIFLPDQEEQERKGIDRNKISGGSFTLQEINIVGHKKWLKDRWEFFLEKYGTLPEEYRTRADFCFPVVLKIYEFQSKKEPEPVNFTKLARSFQGRFSKIEIHIAIDILLDLVFIRYCWGDIDGGLTNGLIEFTSKIPDVCLASA